MSSSTIFTSNRTQAVRLPKAVAFPDHVRRVDVIKVGQGRLIVPQGRRWDDFFLGGPSASDDFMSERVQPPSETREDL
jgi:antitoxin VapB